MNNPNPLIPQGSLLEQQRSKGKSNLVIAVFTILAIHLVLFGGLLMQGCKREKPSAGAEKTNDISFEASKLFANTNVPPPATNVQYYTETPSNNPPPLTNITQPPSSPQEMTPPAAGNLKPYTVVKGDSFYKIAKDHGISLKALQAANPNVDPRKLKPKQTLQIPEAAATAPALTGSSTTPAAEGGQTTYTVKPGDTLIKIARNHKTTVSAIKAANHLTTTRLHAQQKLILPSPKAAPEASGLGGTNVVTGSTRTN